MTTNRLERSTQLFWESSLACRGFMPYVNGQTFKSMVAQLKPLEEQGEFHKIRAHAEELLDMLVHDRQERLTFSRGEVIPLVTGRKVWAPQNPCSEIIIHPSLGQRY